MLNYPLTKVITYQFAKHGVKLTDLTMTSGGVDWTKSQENFNALHSKSGLRSHVDCAYDKGVLYFFDTQPGFGVSGQKQAYFCDPESMVPSIDPPPTTSKKGLWIQTGSDTRHGFYITSGTVNTGVLGISDTNCLTQEAANDTNRKLDAALEHVSSLRASFGAQYNRCEHAQAETDNAAENVQASESKIRDVDVAKGMAEVSTRNILMQTGQSMLAQANNTTEGTLLLLR